MTINAYAKKLLSPDELRMLRKANAPVTGPNGLRRWLAQQSVEAFVKLYFPEEFYLDFPPIHQTMIRDMQNVASRLAGGKSGVKLVRAIPRGHSKSSYYSRILPLHAFLYGYSKLTVLLGNNDDAARRLVTNIKQTLDTNLAIQEDFPGIKGASWGSERLESKDGCTVVSFGVGSGSIRGVSNPFRPTLIICDDIDDDRSVRSVVELSANRDWFDKSVLYLGDNVAHTTSFIVIGTIIRRTSLLQYVLDMPDFSKIVEQAVKRFADNGELWAQWEAWILEQARLGIAPATPEDDTFYQEHKAEMLAGTAMLWDRPDAYYRAMLAKLRSPKAFASELQNNPTDDDGALGELRFVDTWDEADYDLLAAIDPTTKGSSKNDQSAFVEVLFHRKRREIIVSHIDSKQRGYADLITDVSRRIGIRGKTYDALWIEENSAGSVIKDLFEQRFRQTGISLTPQGVYSKIPKSERIGALSEYMQRGQLLFAASLPQSAVEQFTMYPYHKFDDIPDAVAMIVQELRRMGMLDLI